MNKQLLSWIIFILIPIFSNAQTIEILGNRALELTNWDFPTPVVTYQDQQSRLYIKANEGSEGRAPDLVRFDFVTNQWEDLWKNNVNPDLGEYSNDAVGNKDGSLLTIFRNNKNFYVYEASPEGEVSFIGGEKPIYKDTLENFLETAILKDSKGNIYSAIGLIGSVFLKWNGVNWTHLAPFSSTIAKHIDIVIDSKDQIYIAYHATNEGVYVKKYNASLNSWDILYKSSQSGIESYPVIEVISPNELYLCTGSGNENNSFVKVRKYDGNNWSNVGNNIAGDKKEGYSFSDLIKTKTGILYCATGFKDGFVEFDPSLNEWVKVKNIDLSFTGAISGFKPNLFELENGSITNSFFEYFATKDKGGLTVLRYTPTGTISNKYIQNANIKLYPNPVVRNLEISIGENQNLDEISIYNMNGQLVKKASVKNHLNLISIDLTSLIPATYAVVGVTSIKESINIGKIVVQ